MRSLVYTAPGTVAWRDAPEPQLQSDREAIVMPVAASRCDYDTEIVRGASPLPPRGRSRRAAAAATRPNRSCKATVPGAV
jgi:alcohol dehydrogenase